MLESILKFNQKNFYQAKVDSIGAAVRNYAELKGSRAEKEVIHQAKNQAMEVLSSMMAECGISGEDNAYIAIDKEFFTDNGSLDEKRLALFQKEVVKQYGVQQMKWGFSGTSSNFTQLTKRTLSNQGFSYEDLLPLPLKKLEQEKRQNKYADKDSHVYQAFLYADGTASDRIIPEKMKIRFDNLKDASGFDWSKGYSPDNQVNKADWAAGFNKNGLWEKFFTDPSKTTKSKPMQNVRIEPGKQQKNGITILQSKDQVYVLDDLSSLYEGATEFFYSITGELYGAREIDQEASLKNLRQHLSEKGITKVTGIVLRHATKDAVKFYKTALKEFISKKTHFYSRNDNEAIDTLSHIRLTHEEEDVSNIVISDLLELSKRGIKKDDLYDHMKVIEPTRVRNIPLRIFENKFDLETFLALPAIAEVCEQETIDYLKDVHIPAGKQTVFSNTVQNLLYSYTDTFKHKPIKQIDLIRAAEDYIVKNKVSNQILSEKITAEETLYNIIETASGLDSPKEISPLIIPQKESGEYKDIFSEQGFDQWALEELKSVFSPETVATIKNTLATANIPEPDKHTFSRAIQTVFTLYPFIASSTGSTPAEMISNVEHVLLQKTGSEKLQRKRIFFEKQIKDIIMVSSQASPPLVKVEKKEYFHTDSASITWKPFSEDINLFNENDRTVLFASPFVKESSIPDEIALQLNKFIATTSMPEEKQSEFSQGLLHLIRGYNYQLKPAQITLLEAAKILRETMTASLPAKPADKSGNKGGKKKQETYKRLQKIVTKVARVDMGSTIRKPEQIVPIMTRESINLTSIMENGLEAFLASDLVVKSNIGNEDSAKVFRYVQDVVIPEGIEPEFARAFVGLFETYEVPSKPGKVGVIDIIKNVNTALKGEGKIPKKVQPFIDKIMAHNSQDSLGSQDSLDTHDSHETHDSQSFEPIPLLKPGNLLKQEDFKSFVQSDIFKDSGLNENQLHSLLIEYSKVYKKHQIPIKHGVEIPLVYSDDVSLQEPQSLKENFQVLFSDSPDGKQIENDMFNIAYTIKTRHEQSPVISFTYKGEKALSHYEPREKEDNVIIEFAKDISHQQEGSSDYDEHLTPEFPYQFTHGKSAMKYQKYVPESHSNQNTPGNVIQKANVSTQSNFTPETTRHQRMENNYMNDKRMLAKDSSKSILGNSPGAKKSAGGENENIIKQVSDDLLEEMVNKAREEGI